jgi:putative aldouronate transport system substrate-binding protein
MKYLRKLCDEGLFYAGSFTQDGTALLQLGANENDILGLFEGLGFEAAITADNLTRLATLAAVPALVGPEGKHYATYTAPSIRPAGVITANCKYPEVAFRVLDEMMSYEGSLITRYGEQGVNWDYADEGTTSYYGKPAMLKVLENTWAVPGQNQNFFQQTPFILDPGIATGIQWNGENLLDAGYIKALSVMELDKSGERPAEYIANLVYTPEEIEAITAPRNDIETYILRSIANFVAGDWDPSDDKQWDSYVSEYEKMGLSSFVEVVQTVYTRMYAK